MTNLGTASMRRATRAHALVVSIGLAATVLAGCETASSILGGSTPETAASMTPTGSINAPPGTAQPARIAVAPVLGAPDNVSGMLSNWVAEALEKKQVSVSRGKDGPAEFYLRGYVVAAKDVAGTKLSYIWDITDKNGAKRAHRIQGEQIVKAPPGAQDPWAAIDAQVAQTLATQTADKIAKWLPPAVAGAPATGPGPSSQPQPQRALASGVGVPPSTTASLARKSDGTAFIQPVSGAPGDGATALAAAIRRELERKSVPLVEQAGAATNKVEGRVAMGAPANGKQVVQIEWVVTDPSGNQLGIVTQRNTIQQGSLDGSWGQTADSAASAAAVKIASLLKK